MRFQFERVVAINSLLRLLGCSAFATLIGREEWVEVEAREGEGGDGERWKVRIGGKDGAREGDRLEGRRVEGQLKRAIAEQTINTVRGRARG